MVVVRPEDAVGAQRSRHDAEAVGQLVDPRAECRQLTCESGDAVGLVAAQVVDAGECRRLLGAGGKRRDDGRELATVTKVDVGTGDGTASGDDEVATVTPTGCAEALEDVRQDGAGLMRGLRPGPDDDLAAGHAG